MLVPREKIYCGVPVFNNKDTVKRVALECRRYLEHVFVVDDGSTDCNVAELFAGTDIVVLRHEKNKGKGRAIVTALGHAKANHASYLITIDADGQHYPQDLEKFFPILNEHEPVIVIGQRDFSTINIPRRSRFGRDFSNFWFKVETGEDLTDSQSGFRAYPVPYICRLHLAGFNYDFEAEILAKAAWAGLQFKEVEIKVWYPPQTERVSSFRPFRDNLRFTLMHMRLIARRLLPLPHEKFVSAKDKLDFKDWRKPGEMMKILLKENSTPLGLAVSAAAGVFIGALPLFSAHTIVIVYVAVRLHLNKIMAVVAQNICMPPVVPVVCIELGHHLLYKKFLTQFSFQTVFKELPIRAWEWFLGSIVVAPALAIFCGVIVYFAATIVKGKYRHVR